MAITISNQEARLFLLRKHGLLGEKLNSIEDYVRMVGCVQYDPVDICGKNAELVFQSRVKGFTKAQLAEALYEKRTLVEHFDKNMSIFLTEDWPMFYRTREKYLNRTYDIKQHEAEALKMFNEKKIGSSKDLDLVGKVPWFWQDSSKAKVILEMLYFQGKLGIHHRQGAVRFFSLIEDLIPKHILDGINPFDTELEFQKWLVLRRIKSVGLLWSRPSDAFLGIPNFKTSERETVFSELLSEGKIEEVIIQGCKWPFFIAIEDVELLQSSKSFQLSKTRMEFLAPLDNLLWDRKLIEAVFNFSYTWEIYTPEAKRKYSYYVLPVLHNDRFIGRIEMITDKDQKVLNVKNLWLEEGVSLNREEEQSLIDAIERFRAFSEMNTINMTKELSFR